MDNSGQMSPLEKAIIERYGVTYGSKAKFASEVGVSRSAVSLWVKGDYKALKASTRQSIAKALMKSKEELEILLMKSKQQPDGSNQSLDRSLLETNLIPINTVVSDITHFRMSPDTTEGTVPMPAIINASRYIAIGHKKPAGTEYFIFHRQDWANVGDTALVRGPDGMHSVEVYTGDIKKVVLGKLEFLVVKP